VFDALSDPLPFPIPYDGSLTQYQFSRPAHIRLIKACLEQDEPKFFHVVARPDAAGETEGDALAGAVGCIAVIRQVRMADEGDPDDEEAAMLVTVACGGRAVVSNVVSSFPFPTAAVVPLSDVSEDGPLNSEREAFVRMHNVALLSKEIESRGFGAEEAEEQLGLLDRQIIAFQEDALEFNWPVNERRERASFLLVSLCNLPHAAAARALATTSARERFGILIDFLTPLEGELAAKAALESISQSFGPPPVPQIDVGRRIEFFWSEVDGWFGGTVTASGEPAAGWYRICWDSDRSETRIQMDADNRPRWRVLPSA